MSATRRVRWECPSGRHPGVLGPRRPPRDSVVRYCLTCSQETGRLVGRVAPALERERTQARQRAEERAAAKRTREADVERAKRIVIVRGAEDRRVELDVHATVQQMLALPELKALKPAPRWRPGEIVVRRRRDDRVSGRAWPGRRGRMVVSIGDVSVEAAEELILHELIHLLAPSREHHGDLFVGTLVRAAREWWPGITITNTRPVWALDRQIAQSARALNQTGGEGGDGKQPVAG